MYVCMYPSIYLSIWDLGPAVADFGVRRHHVLDIEREHLQLQQAADFERQDGDQVLVQAELC